MLWLQWRIVCTDETCIWVREVQSPWFCDFLWQLGYSVAKEKYVNGITKPGLPLGKSSDAWEPCLGLISDRKDQMQTWRKFQTSNFFLLLMPNSNNSPTILYLLHGSWLTTLILWLLWSMHESFISPTNTQMRWLRSPSRYFPFFMCKSII